MTDVRKTSPWRRFIAVLAALVLVVLGIPTHDAPARAEENDAIKFDPVTLTHVTNTYTKDLGAFVISKILVSGGSEGTDTFGIEYKCSAAGVDDDGAVAATGTVAVTAGVDRVVGRFPAGTTCEVVSEVPSPRAGYALIVDEGQAVTVAKGDTVRVNVTNTYTKDLGAFVISKTLVSGGSTGADTFSVSYRCSAAGEGGVAAEGAVDVSAGAEKVVGRFPAGTTCEVVSEDEAAAARAGYSLTVDKGQAVTVVKGDTVKVNVTNTYTKDSAPSPGPTGAPGPTSSTPPSASYTPSPSADPTVAIHPTAPGVPTPTGKEAGKPVVRPGLPRTGG